MSLAEFANAMGQSVIPQVFAGVFTDTMTITAETTTAGTGGGQIKSGTTNAYTNIPVSYKPDKGRQFDNAGKLLSETPYILTFPTHYTLAGVQTRINVDARTQKLIVDARGNEPAKVFRVAAIMDKRGVVFEAICEKEN